MIQITPRIPVLVLCVLSCLRWGPWPRWGMMGACLGLGMMMAIPVGGAQTLKVAHEYGTDMLEIRHRMLTVMAREISQSGGSLALKIYPEGSLFTQREVLAGLKDGTLEMASFPLERLSGINPLFAMPSMPGLAAHGQAGTALSEQPLMALVRKALADEGLLVLADMWVPGTFASRGRCVTEPADLGRVTLGAAGRPVEALAEQMGGRLGQLGAEDPPGAVLSGGGAEAIAIAEMDLLKPDATLALSCVTMTTDYVPYYIYHPVLISRAVMDSLSEGQRATLSRAALSAERYAARALDRSLDSKMQIFEKSETYWETISRDAYEKWVETGRAAMRRVVAVVDPAAANALGSILVLPAPPTVSVDPMTDFSAGTPIPEPPVAVDRSTTTPDDPVLLLPLEDLSE